MTEVQAVKFKADYERLRAKRSSVDHEVAELAANIRRKFDEGEAGQAPAVDWCMEYLGMSTVAARGFLGDGRAWEAVQTAGQWVAIGGLPSARIVASLTKKQRMVVLSEATAMAEGRKRPVSRTQVRDIAWRHGFVPKAIPKVTEAKRAATLTAFVNRLYATVPGLPPMPPDVKAIVRPPRATLAKAA